MVIFKLSQEKIVIFLNEIVIIFVHIILVLKLNYPKRIIVIAISANNSISFLFLQFFYSCPFSVLYFTETKMCGLIKITSVQIITILRNSAKQEPCRE